MEFLVKAPPEAHMEHAAQHWAAHPGEHADADRHRRQEEEGPLAGTAEPSRVHRQGAGAQAAPLLFSEAVKSSVHLLTRGMPLRHLTEDEIVEINRAVLAQIYVRKADQPRLLSRTRLQDALAMAKGDDAFDGAAGLLIGLVRLHPFASGNRRTAYVAAKMFLELNGSQIAPPHNANVLLGIREGFYTAREVKEWLKGNAIKEFERV